MESLIYQINDIIWSSAFIAVALGVGIYFSIILRFPQLRLVPLMAKLLFRGNETKQGVSSFQAFAMAISGRVGTGNIAGVATAIALGGPGAVFWMWVSAFLGAATAFAESTLGQMYKRVDHDEYRGGPAYYIRHGLGLNWYACIFALATILAMTMFLPGIQAKSVVQGITLAFGWQPWAVGLLIVIPLGLVIFGGVHRIAHVAQILVPLMAAAYILVSLVIIIMNIDAVPKVFNLILSSAFGTSQVFGGIVGLSISWGIKRGIYSNEAGQGSAAHAASAAEVRHPAEQGLVQAFSVYIDTLLVCSATAFMILFTGSYNVVQRDASGKDIGYVAEHLPGVEYGTQFTQYAVDSQFAGYGQGFVAVALFFFAFTTLMAYYYMAETNIAFLNQKRNWRWPVPCLRIVILLSTFYGVFSAAGYVWTLGDIGVGIMAWLNIVALILLRKPIIRTLKDYERQRKSGEPITFRPSDLDIPNASYWEDRQTTSHQADEPDPSPHT
ncbi:alanine:cation symporter family protein [Verrucomicrobiaceae bacterium N1E253]|uniref:Alanine:cation symporter family protein n=1 Tax=Oceaniferula marina TaxID=2748318 RepID=A0A851GEA8_9BACT|nr:alanine:cation symporter family protein [Oceaniferula marina]